MITDRIVRQGVIARNKASGKLWRITNCYSRQICAKQAVLESGNLDRTRYVNEDPSSYTWVAANLAEYLHNVKKEQLKMKLYQIKDTDTFVTRLATNSEGLAVVEEKGTGKVSSIDPGLLIEVVPFTIEARDTKGTIRHFSANKDFWEVNDVFPFEGNLYVVSGVGSNGGDGLKKVPNKKLSLVVG